MYWALPGYGRRSSSSFNHSTAHDHFLLTSPLLCNISAAGAQLYDIINRVRHLHPCLITKYINYQGHCLVHVHIKVNEHVHFFTCSLNQNAEMWIFSCDANHENPRLLQYIKIISTIEMFIKYDKCSFHSHLN